MRALAVSLALVSLLALSLGAKAVTASHHAVAAPGASLPQQFSAAFVAQGFTTGTADSWNGPALVAQSGDCTVTVLDVSPHGWNRFALETQASGSALAYLYGGQLYEQQPVLLTKLGYYLHRITATVLPSPEPAVRAMTLTAACAPSGITPQTVSALLA